jgi:ATP synthase protein I
MTQEPDNHEKLSDAVKNTGQNLAMIGVLGWTIVLPTLLGLFAGRWVDRQFSMGIFWTLGLLVAGLTIGCMLVWRRVHRTHALLQGWENQVATADCRRRSRQRRDR